MAASASVFDGVSNGQEHGIHSSVHTNGIEADAKIENHNRLQLAAAAMHLRMHVPVMQHTSLLCTRACAHPARINCIAWMDCGYDR